MKGFLAVAPFSILPSFSLPHRDWAPLLKPIHLVHSEDSSEVLSQPHPGWTGIQPGPASHSDASGAECMQVSCLTASSTRFPSGRMSGSPGYSGHSRRRDAQTGACCWPAHLSWSLQGLHTENIITSSALCWCYVHWSTFVVMYMTRQKAQLAMFSFQYFRNFCVTFGVL